MKISEIEEQLVFQPQHRSFEVIFWQTLLVADVIFVKELIPRKHMMLATGGATF